MTLFDLFDDVDDLDDGVFIDVSFNLTFDKKQMPSTYTDRLYLEDEIKDAIVNAMHDMGAQSTDDIIINIEGLE